MTIMRKATHALLLASVCAGCGDNTITTPYPKNLVIEVVAGDQQFATPGAFAPEPLEVRITHVRTRMPVKGMPVNWRIVQGTGTELTDAKVPTDSTGLAVTRIRLGSDVGVYRIEATFPGLFDKPATF